MPNFPSGFISYTETFYEVVSYLSHISRPATTKTGENILAYLTKHGRCGMYDLARELTLEFEKKNQHREWDGEFYDDVEKLIIDYFNK